MGLFGDDVGGGRSHHHQISAAREFNMAHFRFIIERKKLGIGLVAREAGGGERRDKFLRRFRHHHADRTAVLFNLADEVKALISGNTPANDEHYAFAVQGERGVHDKRFKPQG